MTRRTINHCICLFGGLAGGLSFSAMRAGFHDADPVVAGILAVMIALQAIVAGVIIRDWRGW